MNPPSIPLDSVLEDLELPRAAPGIGYLERLFHRFNERVPFETASKIRRDAAVRERAEKPRTPDLFWEERLAHGAGGTCFARVAAFQALLAGLGFEQRLALGRVVAEFDHAALLVTLDREEWICDVGFPLPVLFRAREGTTESGMGPVAVSPTPRGWQVELEQSVPDAPRRLEIFSAPVDESDYRSRWEETFRPDSKFLRSVSLRKQLESRAISFARGELRVDDARSHTRIPLAAPRSPILAETFGVEADLLDEALAIAGDPEPEIQEAEIAVYFPSSRGAADAWSAVATPDAYARLFEPIAELSIEPTGPRAWRASLGSGAAGESLVDEASADDAARSLRIARGGRETFWEVVERDGAVWLVRRSKLGRARLDLLRNDSLRGRIAGTLAADLLGWSRVLS